tara:strand:- start:403 stop:921 length:519 start_codon:yes stop_codon:yes gene_type:complete
MGGVKSNHDPLRTVLTPIASTVMLLVLTGWVGLAHQPESEVLNGAMVIPAIREALQMITLIPSKLHYDLLNALGSTLLTLALAGGGSLVVVLKSTTEISPAKSRLFTLLACAAVLSMQIVLYGNQAGAGLQAILMVTLGLLCRSNQCPVVRTTTTLAAMIGWLTWAGTSALP